MEAESSSTHQQPKRINTTDEKPIESQHLNPLPTIPEEVIFDILSRLPVKSLLRFRSVCKSWREFISTTQFVKTHLSIASKRNNHTHKNLIINSYKHLISCSVASLFGEMSESALDVEYFPFEDFYLSVCVPGSCNGLVCFVIEGWFIEGEIGEILVLWNPSIRKCKELILPSIRRCKELILSGIDYDRRYVIYGFGYDDSGDDYKFVSIFCLVGIGGSYKTEVKVYSLRDDSWRRIGDFFHGIPLQESGKFVNGCLHWEASDKLDSKTSWMIVSLDLSKETYGEIAQPDYGEPCFDPTLGVLDGCLYVVSNYRGVRADVWVMKSYGLKESWTMLAAIPYFRNAFDWYYPLCISKDGEILFNFDLKLFLFNPKDGTFRDPVTQNMPECFDAHTYVESMVSPS